MAKLNFATLRLFKYLGSVGAKKTLSTGAIRLSAPSTFNDPFDMRLDEVLGLGIRHFVEAQKLALFERLSGELDQSQLRSGELGKKAALINKMLRSASVEQTKAIKDKLIATPLEQLYNFDSLQNAHDDLLKTLQVQMRRYGVFCMTLHHDSLLMWSHYAQHHEGVVFEFLADVANDSALCASKPVRYSKERPLAYRTPSDLVRRGLTMSSLEAANEIVMDLIFTKSVEWEYENEVRLAIPNFIPEGTNTATLRFAPNELVAVYL
jgi:hypothetical protein